MPEELDENVILSEWEQHAAWWQSDFTEGADVEYVEQILPLISQHLPASGEMLDIGAGEGQVSRLAAAQGLKVTALDPIPSQIEAGRSRSERVSEGTVEWVQGLATDLPFPDDHFDAAVACLVLEHIPDLDRAIAEAARVLRPGGRFLAVINHPLLQTPGSGWIDDQILGEEYWRVGHYLPDATTIEEVARDVFLTFHHRPLGRYLNAMITSGLSLSAYEEPPGLLGDSPTIPRLLFLEGRLAGSLTS